MYHCVKHIRLVAPPPGAPFIPSARPPCPPQFPTAPAITPLNMVRDCRFASAAAAHGFTMRGCGRRPALALSAALPLFGLPPRRLAPLGQSAAAHARQRAARSAPAGLGWLPRACLRA